ncbi:MAG: MBL fold metallo-hydrolase [Anaerolineae bacterium]|nr:MBL fold metallo-hydrolase [Anaerolineae bacterium]
MTFRVGDLEIHLLHEALVKVDAGGAFGLVPRALWSRFLPPDADNMVPMPLHNLALRAGGKTIMIDTGIGDKLPEKWRAIWRLERPHGGLVAGLARLGIAPEDVDLVIDTHLHADHCGGNTRLAEDGRVVPVFPNAEYVVHRREYADASQPNERTRATYLPENFEPLQKSGQLRLLDGEEEALAPGVSAVRTPGHTPGHLSVRFESAGQHALFVCDMASYSIQFAKLGWMTAYDVEPLVTLETKRRWQAWALAHDALLIFPHDHQVPAGRLALDERGQPVIRPEPFAYS